MKNLSEEFKCQLQEYRATASTLRQVLDAKQIAEVEGAIERLESLRVHIAVFGETNAGKSALLNSLFGVDNNQPDEWKFKVDERINAWSDEAAIKNGVRWMEVEGLELVIYDTPGIAGDLREHLEIAQRIVNDSDLILYVMFEEAKGEAQVPVMKELLASDKPIIVVVNKVDLRRDSEIQAIKNGVIKKFGIKEELIVTAAGHPLRGEPLVDDLIGKITTIIEEQNLGLINETVQRKFERSIDEMQTILTARVKEAEEKTARELQRKRTRAIEQKDKADSLVDTYAKAAAGAAALIPFGFDALTSTLVSGGMFLHLAKVYGREIDSKTAYKVGKELVMAFKDIVFVSAATLTGYLLVTKGAKTNPFTYVLGMAIDGAFTYLIVSSIGSTFSYYCANDLTWKYEKEASEVMRQYIKQNINVMFIDKLPARFRDKIVAQLNPDLLR